MNPPGPRHPHLPAAPQAADIARLLQFPDDLTHALTDAVQHWAGDPWAQRVARRLASGLDRTEQLEHLPREFWALDSAEADSPPTADDHTPAGPGRQGGNSKPDRTDAQPPLHPAQTTADPRRDLLPLLVLLSRVPRVLRLHQQRDVPRDVSLDTLDDLLRWARKFRLQHGHWGLAETHWLALAVTGRIFRLGRLQFEWVNNRWPALPFTPDQWLLSVHVPEMGPLDHGACDTAFARAHEFFIRHFPERRAAAFVCDSWLLDPQLGEYLPAETNILRFQHRFTVVPDACYPRDQITERVLPGPADSAPNSKSPSRLQRAIAEHRRRGRGWQSGVGYRTINLPRR